jgi:MscS family membrane protein
MPRTLSLFAAILLALTIVAPGFASGDQLRIPFEKPKDETTKPKVEVSIENGETAGEPDGSGSSETTIKLKVETEDKKTPLEGAANIIREEADPISPVDTKAIDEAGKEIGKKIDESSVQVARYLGGWVQNRVINGITWLKIILSLMALTGIILAERFLSRLIRWRLTMLKRKGKEFSWGAMFLDALRRPLTMFIWVYGVYFAFSPILHEIHPPFQGSPIHDLARKATDVAGVIAAIWLIYRILKLMDAYLDRQARSPRSVVDPLLASFIGKTIRVVLMIVGGFLVMQNLTGVNAAAIVASLGIGGLALALAAKEPLTNIFGTFTILADKPFTEGQWVKIDRYDGFVESVGYRSTRLRTWDGYLVSIPNQKIMTCELENMATREFTRWKTILKLPINTPTRVLDRAVNILEEILDDHECLNPAYPPRVYVSGFDEWSINIWVSCWYYSSDWWGYMAWVHRTCREIKSRFEAEGIRLAVPMHSIHLQNEGLTEAQTLQETPPIAINATG